MNTWKVFLAVLVGSLFSWSSLRASHIYGGNLSMTQLDKQSGTFRVTMRLFVDAVHTLSTEDDYLRGTFFNIAVFSKKNHQRVQEIVVRADKTDELIYDNTSCAAKHGFKTRVYTYSSEVTLDLLTYTDPQGYYLAWERCCRPATLINLVNSGNAGLALYLEFPALMEYNQAVTFSSPQFVIPDGNYACIRKEFRFNFSAVDVDGDSLKYTLVTPWQGHNDEINFDAVPRPAPYPEAKWTRDFSAQRMIPGNPALAIHSSTGMARVNATMLGVFAVAIQCEKIRNGKTIGLVRQDFQLPVIDCSPDTPPVAVIESEGKKVTRLATCGQPVTLNVTDTGPYHYQWKYNDKTIAGANSKSITVKDTGYYTVVKSYSDRCAGDTLSEAVHLTAPQLRFVNENQKICSLDSFKIQVMPLNGYTIRWFKENRPVATGEWLAGKGVGTYQVIAESNRPECPRLTDSIQIQEIAPPAFPGDLLTRYSLCRGDSVQLGTAAQPTYTYHWTGTSDNTSKIFISKEGHYSLTITDKQTGCQTKTPDIIVTFFQTVQPIIDSVSILCSARNNSITLKASPDQGFFTGKGVQGNTFDPSQAGIGLHRITYTTTSGSCKVSASTHIQVVPAFSLEMPSSLWVAPGETKQLKLVSSESVQVRWFPPDGLSSITDSQPLVTTQTNRTYYAEALADNGCKVVDSVQVMVARRMYIPTAFSPNQDGQNDTWEIKNTHLFPTCEVIIFNRWGQPIYASRGKYIPWNGTLQDGTLAPTGVYAYQIKLNDGTDFSYKGNLTILY